MEIDRTTGQVHVLRLVAEGQLLTATFTDYPMLRAHQVTEVTSEFLETPSPFNPLGAKGIGEAGTTSGRRRALLALIERVTHLPVERVEVLGLDEIQPCVADPLQQGDDLTVRDRTAFSAR